MKDFTDFIKKQGVVGFAVGFILGGAVSKVASSLVNDIINPLLGFILGVAGTLKDVYITIGSVKLAWGSFASTMLDFLIVAFVVYFAVRALKLCGPGEKCA